MGYLTGSVNSSATIIGQAGAACALPAMRAFSFDAGGKLVIAGAGAHAIGIAIAETADAIATGDELTVQVKDICPAVAGGAFSKGAELACDAEGKLVKANSGKFILAVALESAAAKDAVVIVQVVKAGYAG